MPMLGTSTKVKRLKPQSLADLSMSSFGTPNAPVRSPGQTSPFGISPIAAKPKDKPKQIYGSGGQKVYSSREDWLYEQAQKANIEAKGKSEASKASALGYFDNIGGDLSGISSNITKQQMGLLDPLMKELGKLKVPEGGLISNKQKRQMIAQRKGALGAMGQNLTSGFSDPDSGIQSGRRLDIGMNIATQSADIPIQTQLEIAEKNRAALMDSLSAKLGIMGQKTSLAGMMSGALGGQFDRSMGVADLQRMVAQGKAGVETAYNYDPGSQYTQQLGYASGQKSKEGSGVSYIPSIIRGGSRDKGEDKKESVGFKNKRTPSSLGKPIHYRPGQGFWRG